MTGMSECSQQRGNLKDDGYSKNLIDNLVGHLRMAYHNISIG
ncbi:MULTISPECIES: hypothetical protein [Photorhabdus]|nr:hypothetical protein [Photorhabdus asymbiotica]